MQIATLKLKKNEERRIRAGHLWIYSNEIDVKTSPLKSFTAGDVVRVEGHDKKILGLAYINPQSLIAARMISRKAEANFDVEFIQKRIARAYAWRNKIYSEPFYRLIFSESDGLPGLIIDRYNTDFVMQLNTAGMQAKQKEIIAALKYVFPDLNSVLLRNDSSSRKLEGLEQTITAAFGTPPEKVLLTENGAQFQAPIWKGQKTGWFFDHRLNRSRLQAYAKNARVLDVFSYLGAWGITAATFGAKEVVCIDSSQTAIDAISENASLNHVTDKVSTLCEDAFIGMKQLIDANEKFDIVILDPPAFVKKFKDKKEGLLAYQRINELAMKLLNPQGLLFSCSCSMHVSVDELAHVINRAANATRNQMHIVEQGHQAQDHPIHLAIAETNYLKMFVVHLS